MAGTGSGGGLGDRAPSAGVPVVLGVDYGTLSGRVVVVRPADGEVLGSAVHVYPHAVIEQRLPDGTPLPPDTALQAPSDWREVLAVAIPAALADAGADAADVVGIGTDFTASTCLPVLRDGTPLCEVEGYAGR